MSAGSNNVVYLHRRVPQEALERLNRVTGLRFSNWPESLVPAIDNATAEQAGVPVRGWEWVAR